MNDTPKKRTGGAPIGTHSLTGGPATVGIPPTPESDDQAAKDQDRNKLRDTPASADEPDSMAGRRFKTGDTLSRKP